MSRRAKPAGAPAVDDWVRATAPAGGRCAKCIACLNPVVRDGFREILASMARLQRHDLPVSQILARLRATAGLPETYSVESATRHLREHEPELWARAKGRA